MPLNQTKPEIRTTSAIYETRKSYTYESTVYSDILKLHG